MKRIGAFPVLSGALFVAWLALTGEVNAAHVLLAATLAIALPLAAAPFLDRLQGVVSARAAVRFALLVLCDIVVANIAVARLVLGPTKRLRPAFVKVPLTLSRHQSIAILASVITMTPGTVSADLAADRSVLLVHVLDCADPEALVATVKQRYERPLMEIFGC